MFTAFNNADNVSSVDNKYTKDLCCMFFVVRYWFCVRIGFYATNILKYFHTVQIQNKKTFFFIETGKKNQMNMYAFMIFFD